MQPDAKANGRGIPFGEDNYLVPIVAGTKRKYGDMLLHLELAHSDDVEEAKKQIAGIVVDTDKTFKPAKCYDFIRAKLKRTSKKTNYSRCRIYGG